MKFKTKLIVGASAVIILNVAAAASKSIFLSWLKSSSKNILNSKKFIVPKK